MELLKLAWRNLWRNRKRTLITIASIFFGVIWSALLTSLQEGSFQNMVDNMVKFTTGYIQVQHVDYFDNKTINNSFESSSELIDLLDSQEKITIYTPRLESFALAASDNKSYGTAVIGINPEVENQISELSKWVVEGEYLSADKKSVIIGEILAKNLELKVGDTIALIGQGYHGVQSAGLFPVRGLLKFPVPDLNRQILYMNLPMAQEFYEAPNLITSMIVMAPGPKEVNHAMKELRKNDLSELAIFTWEELQPQLVQFIDGKKSSGKIFKGILFMLIAFGILGTFIMMMAERKRELGIMVAIGMQRAKLSVILFLESIFIAAIGVLSSIAILMPVISYFAKSPIPITGDTAETFSDMGFEPVIIFNNDWQIFSGPAITIFVIALLISIYPISSIFNFKVVKALRS